MSCTDHPKAAGLTELVGLTMHRYSDKCWRVYLSRLDAKTRRMTTALLAEGDGSRLGVLTNTDLLEAGLAEMRTLEAEQLTLF